MLHLALVAAIALLGADAGQSQQDAAPPAGDGAINDNLTPKPEVPAPVPSPSATAAPAPQGTGTKAEASPAAGDPTAATDAPPKREPR